ncbi:hypothetical protein D1368_07685 [Klebsiella pneumoniae]|nr:hypothetical protein D1368_07685 [Klebsiella pneumoniae]
MMSLWDALRMNMMISYQELVSYKKKKKNNKQIIKSSTLNPALNPPPREIKSIFGIKNIT